MNTLPLRIAKIRSSQFFLIQMYHGKISYCVINQTYLPVDCTKAVLVEFDLTHVMPYFVVVSVAQEAFLPQTPTTSEQGEVIS